MYKKRFRIRLSIEECLSILAAVITVVGLILLFTAAKVDSAMQPVREVKVSPG